MQRPSQGQAQQRALFLDPRCDALCADKLETYRVEAKKRGRQEAAAAAAAAASGNGVGGDGGERAKRARAGSTKGKALQLGGGCGSGDIACCGGESSENGPADGRDAPEKGPTKRFVWGEALHREFVAVLFSIGLKCASPKLLLEMMPHSVASEEGLTTEHVKSHLQKYRQAKDSSRAEFLHKYGSLDQQGGGSTRCGGARYEHGGSGGGRGRGRGAGLQAGHGLCSQCARGASCRPQKGTLAQPLTPGLADAGLADAGLADGRPVGGLSAPPSVTTSPGAGVGPSSALSPLPAYMPAHAMPAMASPALSAPALAGQSSGDLMRLQLDLLRRGAAKQRECQARLGTGNSAQGGGLSGTQGGATIQPASQPASQPLSPFAFGALRVRVRAPPAPPAAHTAGSAAREQRGGGGEREEEEEEESKPAWPAGLVQPHKSK